MTMPIEELDTGGQLKTFVEHNAGDFITKTGTICELANTYQYLSRKQKKELFDSCKCVLDLVKKVGRIVQDDYPKE